MIGFHHTAFVEIPSWANFLNNQYWIVRVEGRNASKKRKAYRAIRKEKLRLVEAGICVKELNAVCKYLVSLRQVNADRYLTTLNCQKQLFLPF